MGGSCGDLRIVLGAYNDSSFSGKNEAAAAPPPPGEAPLQSTPDTYILGTSYFATPRLDTSLGSSSSRRSMRRLNKDGRVPMEDRKGAFDHFKPRALVLSTVRVTAINISTTLSNFFSDQMSSEQRLESMVDSGEITLHEAEKMNEEWENREWQLRIDALPKKVGWALLRFHACTALIRWYEFFMAQYVLRVDGDIRSAAVLEGSSTAASASIQSRGGGGGGGGSNSSPSILSHEQGVTIMDKLTRDPFQASLRTSQLLHNQEHAPGKVISSNGTETSTSRELTKRMFSTCLWANIIPFLAELTVQQGVLIYGYGVYYVAKQKRIRKKREMADQGSNEEVKEIQCTKEDEKDENEVNESAYALSLMFRSSRLSIARTMSWIAASGGGALGSVIYPGWGTVFGIQIGDTVVGALID